jgi:hypothetical protein
MTAAAQSCRCHRDVWRTHVHPSAAVAIAAVVTADVALEAALGRVGGMLHTLCRRPSQSAGANLQDSAYMCSSGVLMLRFEHVRLASCPLSHVLALQRCACVYTCGSRKNADFKGHCVMHMHSNICKPTSSELLSTPAPLAADVNNTIMYTCIVIEAQATIFCPATARTRQARIRLSESAWPVTARALTHPPPLPPRPLPPQPPPPPRPVHRPRAR